LRIWIILEVVHQYADTPYALGLLRFERRRTRHHYANQKAQEISPLHFGSDVRRRHRNVSNEPCDKGRKSTSQQQHPTGMLSELGHFSTDSGLSQNVRLSPNSGRKADVTGCPKRAIGRHPWLIQ
jgi:hypothetical protein